MPGVPDIKLIRTDTFFFFFFFLLYPLEGGRPEGPPYIFKIYHNIRVKYKITLWG